MGGKNSFCGPTLTYYESNTEGGDIRRLGIYEGWGYTQDGDSQHEQRK